MHAYSYKYSVNTNPQCQDSTVNVTMKQVDVLPSTNQLNSV